MSESKTITIPLRDAYRAPLKKRSKVAVRIIREFIKRHLKVDNVKISPELNEEIWSSGIKRPPRRISVRVNIIEEEGVKVAEVKSLEKGKEET
ncbi:MAG: 50S ribosomal protein L31e [Thermofilaceae archaeon]|nr:50S ribosomal protein L31e [Thermofilaceae archaeon]MCX8180706.1 50S ribosomal protein L31e [Thermofilaceae archaeon]MDW8003810.1 50S ribosomal protein L31e [Thermofilaceae archaeon]